MASLALAGIAYLLAVREFFATPRFPRRVVVLGLFLAAVWLDRGPDCTPPGARSAEHEPAPDDDVGHRRGRRGWLPLLASSGSAERAVLSLR